MQRYQLSLGYENSRSGRIIYAVYYGFLVTLLFFWMVIPVIFDVADGFQHGFHGERAWWRLALRAATPFVMGALVAASLVGVVLRAGGWLEGTRLTVRVLRTHTIDLATARSIGLAMITKRLGWMRPPVQLPQLVVAAENGKALRVLLAGRDGVPLPREQLLTLAAVLSTVNRPGAPETARWLHSAAAYVQPSPPVFR